MAETNEKNRRFDVVGPVDIPVRRLKNSKSFDKGAIKLFWEENKELGARRGCYVFAIATKGYRPIYVGKAAGAKGFKQEVFSYKNQNHINHALADTGKGTLVLFFVVLEKKQGPKPDAMIRQVEASLIELAVLKNSDLVNVHGAKKPKWHIEGVVRAKPGKPPPSAQKFKTLMGMK